MSILRGIGDIFAGIILGAASGLLTMFFAMYVVAPLMGNTDEMSSGLIGTFTAVVSIPSLAFTGGVIGYRRFARSARRPR